MISRLNLYDSNLNKINIEALGLYGLKLDIPSPSYSVTTEKVDGGATIVIDKQLNPRILTADFATRSIDYVELVNQKHKLYGLLGNNNEFYIEQTHRPGIVWKCYLDEWNPTKLSNKVTTFSIPLTCYKGYSESINKIKKTFTSSKFIFKNEGNVTIDPRIHNDTVIKFKGASTDLEIKNNTTNESWKYYGTTGNLDWITLESVNFTLNYGVNIFKNTNKKIITFTQDNNEIEISGATGSFELEISTRFYFL